MRSFRSRVVVATFLVGTIFVLPFSRMGVLARAPQAEPLLDRLAVRSSNRVRSTALLTPRLTRGESWIDGGRARPISVARSSPPIASDPARPGPRRPSPAPDGRRSAFPLRC